MAIDFIVSRLSDVLNVISGTPKGTLSPKKPHQFTPFFWSYEDGWLELKDCIVSSLRVGKLWYLDTMLLYDRLLVEARRR